MEIDHVYPFPVCVLSAENEQSRYFSLGEEYSESYR